MERLSRPAGERRLRSRPEGSPRRDRARGPEVETEPCLRCGVPLPVRLMGCKGGRCPNCGHPYPHGDCSD